MWLSRAEPACVLYGGPRRDQARGCPVSSEAENFTLDHYRTESSPMCQRVPR